MDITLIDTADLCLMRSQIDGEISRRCGAPIPLWGKGVAEQEPPPGGAILHVELAGDCPDAEWHSTADAANAALRILADGRRVTVRQDGGLFVDLTHEGCSESRAWVEVRIGAPRVPTPQPRFTLLEVQ
jgi:hypothetical protein